MTLKDIGVNYTSLNRYINDNIYTLPGIDNHQDKLTVLLTGSRAFGKYTHSSDVDIDVLCTREVYNLIQAEMLKRDFTTSIDQAFYNLPKTGWEQYFGPGVERPHFTITPIEEVKRQIEEYQDIPLWVWSNALILNDPRDQFKDIIDNFHKYPEDILKTKIKYRYLLSSYWLIDGYPHNHAKDADFLSAAMALLNGIHELYRFFFLVEGKPYPYSEKLSLYVTETKLGKRFKPFTDRIINMVVGYDQDEKDVWKRLDRAIELILYGNISPESNQLFDACDEAMIDAGIEEPWVKSSYDNIDDLLLGRLGPIP
jgi:hypothetical protein